MGVDSVHLPNKDHNQAWLEKEMRKCMWLLRTMLDTP